MRSLQFLRLQAVATVFCLSAHAVHLNSPLFAWDNVDLGPKLDVAPISREEAGQALTVAMTMPGAYTELSALLHCTNGPDALAKKAAFVAKTMDHSQMPVLKHAYLELLKDCIVAKAQHQNMRKEIVRIISMGKASRVVHDRSKRLQMLKANIDAAHRMSANIIRRSSDGTSLLQDGPDPAELAKLQEAVDNALKSEASGQSGPSEPTEEWAEIVKAVRAAVKDAPIAEVPAAPAAGTQEIASLLDELDGSSSKGSGFVPDVAMTFAAKAAYAAYKSRAEFASWASSNGVTDHKFISGEDFADADTGVDGYVGKFSNSAGSGILVAFRGTETGGNDLKLDATTDLNAFGAKWPYGDSDAKTEYVHLGFLTQYHQARPGLMEKLVALNLHTRSQKVIITGHSLGAALSWLAARDIKAQFPNVDISLITFAAPGSGNAAFTAATQSKIANRFHFVYKADLVPCLPTYVGYPEPQPYRMRANKCTGDWFDYNCEDGIWYERPTGGPWWGDYSCKFCWSAADHNMDNYCGMVNAQCS